jgi:hypothetical protein
MKELVEYRSKLMERLSEAAKEFRTAGLAVPDLHIPLADGWSVHQIAVHTRDVDHLVYGLRVRRTAVEDNPEFPNFDGNVYLAENYDASEPLKDVLDSLVESTGALVEFLQTLPAEAWSRPSRHATLGSGLTLQGWVEKNLAHIEEHLQTVKGA